MRTRLTASIALSVAITALAASPGSAQQTGHPPGHSQGHATPSRQPAPKAADKQKPSTTPTHARPVTPRADSGSAHRGHTAPRDTAKSPRQTPGSTSPDSARAQPVKPTAMLSPAPAAGTATALNTSDLDSSRATAWSDVAIAPAMTALDAAGEAAEREAGRRRGAAEPHAMWMKPVGGGWHVMGMAQVFPTMTVGSTRQDRSLLRTAGVYATQPAIMANVASPNARVVLRTTLNFEGLTQENGELTFGGWGEGFIDSRHPHTLLHEAMLTANWWNVGGGALSLSAGKGFAPYGTDDPMARPTVKFPTNHHLSQVLERWTVNAAYLVGGWGLEAGLFGGAEPTSAYDFSNIESFSDSWSARLSKRFGEGFGPAAPWELAGSFARIKEKHHGKTAVTELFNANVRHAQGHGFGTLYTLAEWSRSNPAAGPGHYSVLGEALLGVGAQRRHQPYARVEYATRPEYERLGAPGTPDFYRYDHNSHEIGATRWLIATVGYGYGASALPTSVRPYVELQRNTVRNARGDVDPRSLFGSREFWSVSAGARIFIGGGPMRMGSYGALDPMTAAMRPRVAGSDAAHGAHQGH